MTLLSQSAYARRLGLSAAAISQWKAAGRLVMDGALVDVEKTDEFQRRYRRAGLPDVQDVEPVARGRPSKAQPLNLARLRRAAQHVEPVELTAGEIEQRLRELDFNVVFEWSDAAQDERARLAAFAIGYQAVTSQVIDDGHWGHFQLRDPRWVQDGVLLDEAAVVAGHGFELHAVEVLSECRRTVTPWHEEADDGANTPYPVNLVLLATLAFPHYESQEPGSVVTG